MDKSKITEIFVSMPTDVNHYDPDATMSEDEFSAWISAYFQRVEQAIKSAYPSTHVDVDGSDIIRSNIFVNDDADYAEVIRDIQQIIDNQLNEY